MAFPRRTYLAFSDVISTILYIFRVLQFCGFIRNCELDLPGCYQTLHTNAFVGL